MTDTVFTRTGTNLIVFTDEEWARVTGIAKARSDRNPAKDRTGSAPLRGQEAGVAAEAAFGLAAGMDPDIVWETVGRPGKTPGWHWVMDGTKIRVMGTERPGNLVENVRKARADVYVLGYVKPEERSVALLGWVPRDELVRKPMKTTKGPGWEITSYWVPANDLLWMSRLWTVLEVAA